MKSACILLVFCTIVAVSMAMRMKREQYTTKYDNINLDDIISNERLFQNYVKCLSGKGKCTTDGSELKKVLPDALQTKCSKCNEKQKIGAEKVMRHIIENKPAIYKELEAIYDPKGIFRALYEKEAREKGIEFPPQA